MIYFDNAASSWPKPEAVVEASREWFGENGANPGRSSHRPGTDATRAIRETRHLLARLLGVEEPSRIAFTSGATHGLNQALKGTLQPGDHVVTSALEHNSVLRPLHQLAERGVVEFSVVEPDERGRLRPGAVADALRPQTRLVTVNHASNVVGTVQPVREIVEAVRRERGRDAVLLLDAAQTAGVLELPVAEWDLDLVAVAGHKGLFGLQGVGALYVRPGLELEPLAAGGTGSQSHVPRHPEEMPDRLEAGTANTPGIVSLGAGVRYLLETGLDTVREREARLFGSLLGGLREIDGVTVHNPPEGEDGEEREGGAGQVAVAAFDLGDADPEEAAFLYDRRFGIALRAGIHCAPWTHRWLGTLEREPQGALRASPGFFNTDEEVERFLDATRELAELMLPGGAGPEDARGG